MDFLPPRPPCGVGESPRRLSVELSFEGPSDGGNAGVLGFEAPCGLWGLAGDGTQLIGPASLSVFPRRLPSLSSALATDAPGCVCPIALLFLFFFSLLLRPKPARPRAFLGFLLRPVSQVRRVEPRCHGEQAARPVTPGLAGPLKGLQTWLWSGQSLGVSLVVVMERDAGLTDTPCLVFVAEVTVGAFQVQVGVGPVDACDVEGQD